MISNNVDEAIFLSDRIVPMTPGPRATLRIAIPVPLYCHVIDFLEHHVQQFRPSVIDAILHSRQ
jgi:ABC-type nitrate/sulfonate/bicarbonate transport system ATPase subunit